MRIVVRTDGSRELGMGHVTRSVAVADALRELGVEVAFKTVAGIGLDYIVEHGQSVVWNIDDDVTVVNDMPPGSVVPNGWRQRQIFLGNLLTGPEMMPIRREVLGARDMRALHVGGHYGVLVTAGWSDSWGLADVMREQASQQEALFVPSAPGTMLAAAARCSLAVVTMGVTAWELACVGVPMVVVAPTEQHFADAHPLKKSGSAVVVSRAALAGRYVGRLLGDRPELQSMGAAGCALVDGLGAMRVAEKIMES